MLSIIISSYQPDYFDQFSINVKETIGENFLYEIIQIWNPSEMGICEAYNKGAEQAKYDYLLFIHEDVLFETHNWGNILIDYLKDETIGCVGVAGSSIKTKFPLGYWYIKENLYINIKQYIPRLNIIQRYYIENDIKAKILDGVFIAVRKNVWTKYKFNGSENNSFHGYDVEFTLSVSTQYLNYITNKILITHFSFGNPNKDWFKQIIRIYQKKNFKNSTDFLDVKSIEFFFREIVRYNLTKNEMLRIFYNLYNPLDFTFKENLKVLNLFKYYFGKLKK